MAPEGRVCASKTGSTQTDSSITPELFESGCVYVIDLVAIRTSSGPLWDRTKQGVISRMHTIAQRLVPDCSIIPMSDEQARWLVATQNPEDESAVAGCVRTAHDLISGLIGRCDIGDIHVSRAVWDDNEGVQTRRIANDEVAAILERTKSQGLVLPPHMRRKAGQPVGERSISGQIGIMVEPRQLHVEYKFEPVWDARNEAVIMYSCTPQTIVATGNESVPLGSGELSIKEGITLDIDGLLLGIEQLSTCLERDDRFLLNVPISFETLASPFGRTEVSTICRGILPIYRQYMIFTLKQVPLGVSMTRLSELIVLLRPFAPVIATIANSGRNYGAYQSIGLTAIALDLSFDSKERTRTHSDILNIAAAARFFKLGAAVYGIDSPDLAAFAHAADIRLLSGSSVGTPLDAPKRIFHLARHDIIPSAENAGEEEWF